METRFTKVPNVSVAASTPRVTPTTASVPFGEIMSKVVSTGADMALNVLPGGSLVALALRGGSGSSTMNVGTSNHGTSALTGSVASGTSAASQAVSQSAEGPTPSGGTAGTEGSAGSLEGAMAQSQEMNMYYLRIQEQVNAQNRSFSTLSNVMKAEHETVKTAIGNIR